MVHLCVCVRVCVRVYWCTLITGWGCSNGHSNPSIFLGMSWMRHFLQIFTQLLIHGIFMLWFSELRRSGCVGSTHYNDVIMSTMASQITGLTIVFSNVYSRRRSKKTSKLRVTGLCEGNSPVTGEYPAQRVGNAENVSIWWRHHEVRNATLKS